MMNNSLAEQDCSITVQGVKCIPFEDNGIMTIDLRSAGFLKKSIPGELLCEEQKISRILLCHEDGFSFVQSTIWKLSSNIKNKTIEVFGECDKANSGAQEFGEKYLWKTGHVKFDQDGEIFVDLNCKSVKVRMLSFFPQKSVKEISLTGLEECFQLQELCIDGSKSYLKQPVILPKSKNLCRIELRRCALKQLPVGLDQCPQLRWLNLNGNEMLGQQPVNLPTLTSLTHLDMAYCGLQQLPVGLDQCPQLQMLNLDNNEMLGQQSVNLPTLTSLTHLFMRSCGLKRLPVGLEECSGLRHLSIGGDANVAIQLTQLCLKLPNLATLLFNYHEYEQHGTVWYKGISRVRDLPGKVYLDLCDMLNQENKDRNYEELGISFGYSCHEISSFAKASKPVDVILSAWAGSEEYHPFQLMELKRIFFLRNKFNEIVERYGGRWYSSHFGGRGYSSHFGGRGYSSHFGGSRYPPNYADFLDPPDFADFLDPPDFADFLDPPDFGGRWYSSHFGGHLQDHGNEEEQGKDEMTARPGGFFQEYRKEEEREKDEMIAKPEHGTSFDVRPDIYESVCERLNAPFLVEDYNFLAEILGYTIGEAAEFKLSENPADAMLCDWTSKPGKNLRQIIGILEAMERHDVAELLKNAEPTAEKTSSMEFDESEILDKIREKQRNRKRERESDATMLWFPFTAFGFPFHGDSGEKSRSFAEAKLPPSLSIRIPEVKDLPNLAPFREWESVELPVDVLLLALTDDEFYSCLQYLEDAYGSFIEDFGFVCFGEVADGHSMATVLLLKCSSASVNNCDMEIVAKKAVKILQPKAIFSIGFRGGQSNDKAKLGDVVMSQKSGDQFNFSQKMIDVTKAAASRWHPPLMDQNIRDVEIHYDERNVSAIDSGAEGHAAADFHAKIDWVKIEGIAYYTDVTQEPTTEWKRFASVMAASVTNTILKEPDFQRYWTHNGETDEREQKFSFTIGDEGGNIAFPYGRSFLQFPAKAVPKPITITCSRIQHSDRPREPKIGDVFCSRIVHMEPEGLVFNKPVTVLMFHSAFESGAYRDYYDVTVQQLEENWNDLDTDRISEHKDLANLNISDLNDVTRYLPLAKADITKTGTVVVATRISSEKFDVYHDELCVYPRSYGEESQLEILFPVGAVEKDCCLNVQVFPPERKRSKDDLICLPTIRISGRDEDFLKPVKVELCYRTTAVASLDEEFLPIGKIFPFSSKYGVLLTSCDHSQAIETWKNVSDKTNATIERIEKDRLRIKFSVRHFFDFLPKVKLREDASVENSPSRGPELPGIRVACFAGHEIENSIRKVTAVLGPMTEKDEIRRLWGHDGAESYHPLRVGATVHFCVRHGDGHLFLPGNNISLFEDGLSQRRNRINSCDPIVGERMHFLYEECVDGNHSEEHCFCECDIMSKQTTAQIAGPRETSIASTPLSNVTLESDISAGEEEFHTSSDDKATSDDQKNKVLQEMKESCKIFNRKVEEYCKEWLEVDGDSKKSKIIRYVDDAGTMTAIPCGFGSGLAIALGTATVGIPALAEASAAAAGLVVRKMDEREDKKIVQNVEEIKENSLEFRIISIAKEVGYEISRLYKEQICQMNRDDVSTSACGTVNLMFKSLKHGDNFNRDELLKKVLEGGVKNRKLRIKKHNKKWKFPDVFQEPDLRKEIAHNSNVENLTGSLNKDAKEESSEIGKNDEDDFEEYFLERGLLQIKDEICKKIHTFRWLSGGYGVSVPSKKINRIHLFITVKRGYEKRKVLTDLKEAFTPERIRHIELVRDKKISPKPKFNFSSDKEEISREHAQDVPSTQPFVVRPSGGISSKKPSTGSNSLSNPMASPDQEAFLKQTSQASGTLTTFGCLSGEASHQFALTCYHVGCCDDAISYSAVFDKKNISDVHQYYTTDTNNVHSSVRRNQYFYHENPNDDNQDLSSASYGKSSEEPVNNDGDDGVDKGDMLAEWESGDNIDKCSCLAKDDTITVDASHEGNPDKEWTDNNQNLEHSSYAPATCEMILQNGDKQSGMTTTANDIENNEQCLDNTIPLGKFWEGCFDNECDILCLKLDEGVHTDCSTLEAGDPGNREQIHTKLKTLMESNSPVLVEKYGFKSGRTTGRLINSGYNHFDENYYQKKKGPLFKKMYVVEAIDEKPFFEEADSGALVLLVDRVSGVKYPFAYAVCDVDYINVPAGREFSNSTNLISEENSDRGEQSSEADPQALEETPAGAEQRPKDNPEIPEEKPDCGRTTHERNPNSDTESSAHHFEDVNCDSKGSEGGADVCGGRPRSTTESSDDDSESCERQSDSSVESFDNESEVSDGENDWSDDEVEFGGSSGKYYLLHDLFIALEKLGCGDQKLKLCFGNCNPQD